MTNKRLLILISLYTFAMYAAAQEKTTYRGDTALYPQIRNKIDLISDSITKFPNNSRLLFTRATLNYDIENWIAADKDLTTAISIDSSNYMYYYKRGAVRDRLQKMNDAYYDFTKAISLNSKFEWAYLDRGIILGNSKYFKDAEQDFKKALSIKPNWGAALFCLGTNYEDQGNIDTALYYYKQAVIYDSTEYKAYNNIGSIYIKQKKFDLAIQQFDKALSIWDKYTFALTNRAEAKYQKGDTAGACADLQKAINLGRTDKIAVYKKFCE